MIDIIVVNLNTGDQLINLILSIKKHHAGLVASVIIVDNGSWDNSMDLLHEKSGDLPFAVHVFHNDDNLGFAAACNQGAAKTTADYILFLNPDTRLLDNSLKVPLLFMEKPGNEAVGIVGIQLLDENDRLTKTCSYFPKLSHFVNKALGLDRLAPDYFLTGFMLDWDHKTSRRVDVVMGAFYLVRRSFFEALGGFDERFFVYFEEGDFALRARLAGYETYYLSEAQAYHRGCGASDQLKVKRLFFSWQSRIRYAYKHFGWTKANLLLFVTLFIEPFSRMVANAANGSLLELKETLHGYILLWRSLPSTLRSWKRTISNG